MDFFVMSPMQGKQEIFRGSHATQEYLREPTKSRVQIQYDWLHVIVREVLRGSVNDVQFYFSVGD